MCTHFAALEQQHHGHIVFWFGVVSLLYYLKRRSVFIQLFLASIPNRQIYKGRLFWILVRNCRTNRPSDLEERTGEVLEADLPEFWILVRRLNTLGSLCFGSVAAVAVLFAPARNFICFLTPV
jgi:hypothetical protein